MEPRNMRLEFWSGRIRVWTERGVNFSDLKIERRRIGIPRKEID